MPWGNDNIGERSKCRQAELEWMKFPRDKIKLTSLDRADSKTFGSFSYTIKCGLEFIGQCNGKKANENFIFHF